MGEYKCVVDNIEQILRNNKLVVKLIETEIRRVITVSFRMSNTNIWSNILIHKILSIFYLILNLFNSANSNISGIYSAILYTSSCDKCP
mgnify:CR=1 FL=1